MFVCYRAKRHPKASRAQKQQRREAEAREVAEAQRRVVAEAPPAGVHTDITLLEGQSQSDHTYFSPTLTLTPLSLVCCISQTNPLAADLTSPQQPAVRSRAEAASTSNDVSSSEVTPSAAPSSAPPRVVYSGVRQFAELSLSSRTQRALSEKGFSRLTDIQRAAIPHALAGRDILGAARTGSGKTLAFLVPALETLWRSGWRSSEHRSRCNTPHLATRSHYAPTH